MHPEIKEEDRLENVYRITYFVVDGGRSLFTVYRASGDKPMDFCARIRGLQQSGGQGALPDIPDVHIGPILITRPNDPNFHYLILPKV